jgi:hypothetical protein
LTHRYWHINFSGVNACTEFHFSAYIGQFSQVREFRIYDMRSGTKKHYLSIPAGALPISVVAQSWAAAGGQADYRLKSTIALSPAGSTLTRAPETASKPGDDPYTSTTIAALTNVTLLSITGKGGLRFLGTGHSATTGEADLTVG